MHYTHTLSRTLLKGCWNVLKDKYSYSWQRRVESLKLPFLTVIEGGWLHVRTDESWLGHVVDNAALELLQEPEVT